MVNADIMLPFRSLLSSRYSNSVRLSAMEGLVRVCGHIIVRSDSGPGFQLLVSLLELASDTDYNIRLKFRLITHFDLSGNYFSLL